MSKAKVKEPHWEPLPRQSFSAAQTAGIVVRHLVPAAGVFVLGWSAGEFVLLSLFNICFSIVCIGVIGVVVSTRQEIGPSPNPADAIGTWLFAMLLALVGSVLLTAMFGWVIALLMVSDGGNLFEYSLLVPALIMVVSAAPALYRQYTTDLAGGLSETQRRRRDQPNVLVLVLNAGLIFIMSGYAGDFGRFGLYVLVIAVTALCLFRDLRPDLMRELARPSNMPPTR